MFEDQLRDIPAEPPRSPALLPGLKLRSALPRSLFWFPLAFAVILCLMPIFIITQDPHAQLALGHSEITSARVLSASKGDGCNRESTDVSYAFTPVGGPEFRGFASICRGSPYFNVRPGDSIPVKFLVRDPSINAIANEKGTNPDFYVMFFIFPLFALLMFAPFFVPQLRRLLGDRKLFRKGRVSDGTVLFVKQNLGSSWPGWPGSSVSEVFVRYQLSSGAPAEARAGFQNEWLLHHLAPGTRVRIAYDPAHPSKAVLLEAYVR